MTTTVVDPRERFRFLGFVFWKDGKHRGWIFPRAKNFRALPRWWHELIVVSHSTSREPGDCRGWYVSLKAILRIDQVGEHEYRWAFGHPFIRVVAPDFVNRYCPGPAVCIGWAMPVLHWRPR